MKNETPAKQCPDVKKSKRKVLMFRALFWLVKVVGYALVLIDKYWPKIVEAYRELF